MLGGGTGAVTSCLLGGFSGKKKGGLTEVGQFGFGELGSLS